jgi:hypothetical protein
MSGRGRQRMRSALVIVETAIALMLLVGAGLFLRSLAKLETVSPGFDSARCNDGLAYSSTDRLSDR